MFDENSPGCLLRNKFLLIFVAAIVSLKIEDFVSKFQNGI